MKITGERAGHNVYNPDVAQNHNIVFQRAIRVPPPEN